MSNTITPTTFERWLRSERASGFGRYPSRRAAVSMRCFVSLGIYRDSGALFRTMETVDAEYPLLRATSRIVTTALFGMVSDLNSLRGMPRYRQAMFWSNEDS